MSGAGLYRGWQRVRDRAFALVIRRSFAAFGRRSMIQPPVRLQGEERIALGDEVFVGAGSWLMTLADDATIEIGDRCAMSGACVLSAAASIRLGEAVLLARNVYIADHSHEFTEPGRPVMDQGLHDVRPVTIGAGAWLGQNVVVLPGVTIGPGAVIAANSVVRDDVPAGAVAAGAPARVVKRFAPTAAA